LLLKNRLTSKARQGQKGKQKQQREHNLQAGKKLQVSIDSEKKFLQIIREEEIASDIIDDLGSELSMRPAHNQSPHIK
jgi:capsular polysaccharide biosynthesis protein